MHCGGVTARVLSVRGASESSRASRDGLDPRAWCFRSAHHTSKRPAHDAPRRLPAAPRLPGVRIHLRVLTLDSTEPARIGPRGATGQGPDHARFNDASSGHPLGTSENRADAVVM